MLDKDSAPGPFRDTAGLDRFCAIASLGGAVFAILAGMIATSVISGITARPFFAPVGDGYAPAATLVTGSLATLFVLALVFLLAGFGLWRSERRGFVFAILGFGICALTSSATGLAILAVAILIYCVLRVTGNLGPKPI
jgi:hypothetical protein